MNPLILFLASFAVLVVLERPSAAQAWTFPARTGAITFVVQELDHVGRMLNDGQRRAVGTAVNFGVGVEVDYGFTDRLSISAALPFIMSKFNDEEGPPPGLPFPAIDECRCWNNAFADFGVTARYNFINRDEVFVLTPFVSAGVPSHAYDYVGEAVVGRRLPELRVGAYADQRLDVLVQGLSVQAGYGYTLVERVLDVPNNRSNGSFVVGMAFPRGLSTRAIFAWQRTHGGLRFPCEIYHPVTAEGVPVCDSSDPLPEELKTEFHRMLRDNYLRIGAGVGYGFGSWALSGEYLVTARGSNSHDINVLSITFSRAFEFGGP